MTAGADGLPDISIVIMDLKGFTLTKHSTLAPKPETPRENVRGWGLAGGFGVWGAGFGIHEHQPDHWRCGTVLNSDVLAIYLDS